MVRYPTERDFACEYTEYPIEKSGTRRTGQRRESRCVADQEIQLATKTVGRKTSVQRTSAGGKPIQNEILLAISDAEFRALRAHLGFINLRSHLILHEAHRKLKFFYFPNSGLISLVVVLNQGKTVEAGIVGREGVAGMPSAAGLTQSPLREVMQIAGEGFRVKVDVFKRVLTDNPQLRNMINRYIVLLGMQVAQTAACNRLHDVEQRLARWLLMAADRVESGFLPITHDFLATMLGTDRPSVTLAAGNLQKLRLIHYRRGSVKIIDRAGLIKFACECYGVIRRYTREF